MAHPPSEASSGPLGQAFASALLRDEILLVLVLDREARIAAFNPACERTLGVRGAEVLGEPVWTLVPEDQRSDLRAAFQNVLETGRSALHEGEWTTGSGHR